MEHRRSQSIVQDKSFRFTVKIVAYIRRQQKDHVNLVLTRQLIRSGTSIGANVEEALEGQSSKDFVAKRAIAAKETRKAGDGMDHYQILNEKCGMRNESARRNVVLEKSFAFAVGIVKTGRRLQLDRREWVLSKQLIRSGTFSEANIEEAIAAQSKKDFLSKMSIALKEAQETHYWLRVIRDSDLANGAETEAHIPACQELVRLLSSITLTTRENLESTPRARRADRHNSTFHIPHSSLRP